MYKDFQRSLPGAHYHFNVSRSLWSYTRLDAWLLLFLALLCLYGLFVLYSASGQDSEYVSRQGLRIVVGFLCMAALAQIRPRVFLALTPWAFLLGFILLVFVEFFGVSSKGAQRWLQLPSFRFQPSELMKLCLPIAVAAYLVRDSLPPSMKRIVVSLILIFLPVGLIIKQPDLGTGILIAASGIFVILLSGLYWRYIFAATGLLIASIPLAWQFMKPYQQQRVLTFLDPESDPLGSGWNIIQSKTAIGSGGYYGKGWQNGTQSQLNFLPESHTDFIVAVIGEELGFRGIFLLLILYLCIIARGLMLASRTQDGFSRLTSGALILTFFVYIFVNIGMVMGLLPVVGVPLPMVSYGGTSLVTLMASFGIMMSLTHSSNKRLK